MITDFFPTLQNDLILLWDAAQGRLPQVQGDKKVGLAAIRVLAAFGMTYGAIVGISGLALAASAPVGAVLTLAVGVVTLLLSRDIFVMSQNETANMNEINHAVSIAKSLWEDVKDLWNGRKEVNDPLRKPITENTVFRPIWDKVLSTLASQEAN